MKSNHERGASSGTGGIRLRLAVNEGRKNNVLSVRWIACVARLAALAVALLVGAEDADARSADGPIDEFSFGTGLAGGLTLASAFVAEAAAVGHASMRAQAAPAPYPGGSLRGLFSRGLLGGFAAGFLGSGLLGLLFGRGLFGELGGVASYLGLILQLALVVMLCRLIWTRWRGGERSGGAAWSPRQLAAPYLRSRHERHGDPEPVVGADDAHDRDKTLPNA